VTNVERFFERAYSMHNAGRSRIDGGRWVHVTLGWNCRPTEYQAALLIHRLETFDRMQAVRRRNAERLRELMIDIACLEPVAVHPGVRAHGLYMFAMRYRPERCGGLSVDEFLEHVGAEGAPIYRAFEATISEQPAMRDLIRKRPQYIRCLPTPVADQAVRDTVYIAQFVFLGATRDMDDIAAAIKKVERSFAGRRRPVCSSKAA
jgi:dTDP-4-amino-4,6-dideoxygalactose transaminase